MLEKLLSPTFLADLAVKGHKIMYVSVLLGKLCIVKCFGDYA